MRDSSLSACTQAVIAAEVGQLELAFDYLGEAALMDLRDLEHNTRDGVHIASLAGAWIALVGGFGGLRHRDGTVSFAPRLPQALSRLSFSILIRGRRLRVEATHTAATYYIADGKPLDILHYGEEVRLSPGHPKVRPSRPNRPGRAPASRRGGNPSLAAEPSRTEADRACPVPGARLSRRRAPPPDQPGQARPVRPRCFRA